MRITKHGHACLEIEQSGARVLIDPGMYTESMDHLEQVQAIVITHLHDDHCYEKQVESIIDVNPNAKIFGTSEVAKKLAGFQVTVVHHGDSHQVGEFELEFSGDLHQVIHRSIPLCQNTAVTVNRTLFYPGDSYTQPEFQPEVVAIPSSAPWLRISDVIDYIEAIKPQRAFATHNALLSEHGHKLQNSRIQEFVAKNGGEFRFLEVGDSWDL